jgi:hypothetical protein
MLLQSFFSAILTISSGVYSSPPISSLFPSTAWLSSQLQQNWHLKLWCSYPPKMAHLHWLSRNRQGCRIHRDKSKGIRGQRRWKARTPNRPLPKSPRISVFDGFYNFRSEKFLRINLQWCLVSKPSFCRRVIDAIFCSLVYKATESIRFSARKFIAWTVRADARFLLRCSGSVAAG